MTPEQAHALAEAYEMFDWQLEVPESENENTTTEKCLNTWLRPHEAGSNANCGICHPEIVSESGGFGVLDHA